MPGSKWRVVSALAIIQYVWPMPYLSHIYMVSAMNGSEAYRFYVGHPVLLYLYHTSHFFFVDFKRNLLNEIQIVLADKLIVMLF